MDTDKITFQQAYDSPLWRGYVAKVVRGCLKRYRLPEVTQADMVADAWARVWRLWDWIQGTSKPIVSAGTVARQACSETRVRWVGRKCIWRGQSRGAKGWRDARRLKPEHDNEAIRQRGPTDSPVMRAILYEELARFGGNIRALLLFYRAGCFLRDQHFRGVTFLKRGDIA